jgi:NitT/TauT family transport system substrate-binding protein
VPVRRSRSIGLCAGALLAVFGIATASASAAEVRIGVLGASSDAPYYIADAKGYFRAEGIDAVFVNFTNTAQLVAPLGTGQLDVGSGAPSASLYNAVARGIDIKIVADKGSMPPGYGFMPMLVRKDLIESGKVKSFADLRGLKIGSPTPGGANISTLNEALKKGGLTMKDIEPLYMGQLELALALENKALDAALVTEPNATLAIDDGKAVRFAGGDEIYPNQQLSVVVYGGDFIRQQHDAAQHFMNAYIRAARDYNDALKGGHLAGPGAGEIIEIMTRYAKVKDPRIYRDMVPNGVDPNGRVNLASLKKDHDFFASQGLLKGEISVETLVDLSFADAAVAKLGSYQRKAE